MYRYAAPTPRSRAWTASRRPRRSTEVAAPLGQLVARAGVPHAGDHGRIRGPTRPPDHDHTEYGPYRRLRLPLRRRGARSALTRRGRALDVPAAARLPERVRRAPRPP